jgi:mannose-6-phosphate isomerase-like protein (cupin superfamily)
MAGIEGKSFDAADETREFENGKLDVLRFQGATVGRVTLQPGWRWSENVKPIAGTESCQQHHLGYVVSGSIHVVADDGTEVDARAGDAYQIPPGHDAWVPGDEPFVGLEFQAKTAETYAAR